MRTGRHARAARTHTHTRTIVLADGQKDLCQMPYPLKRAGGVNLVREIIIYLCVCRFHCVIVVI